MDMSAGMVIIGAGECGARAASALREHGYQGPVTLVGDEPHHPYERPPLSKDVLSLADAPPPKWVSTPEAFAEKDIACITGKSAVAIDRSAKTVGFSDGMSLPYDKLLLATGAVPRRLALAEQAGERIAYLRTFGDALAIRAHLKPGRRVAIVGGGFIGLELAASARKRGCEVTIVEAQPRILMRGVPEEIAGIVAARHLAEGVELICGTGLTAIAAGQNGVRVALADGRAIDADLAVIGIGATPVTQLAESAGLTLDNGIAVDEFLRTSDPHIYAAGDCCSFPLAIYGGRRVRLESWRNAQDQGTLAAAQHAGRRRGDLGGAVVLVGSIRSHAADRRTGRRCDATGAARPRRRRLHPVSPGARRTPARRQRHRAWQCGRQGYQAGRNADRPAGHA